jgi:hypothetical protein
MPGRPTFTFTNDRPPTDAAHINGCAGTQGNPTMNNSVLSYASPMQNWAIAAPRAVSEREPSDRMGAPGA